MNPISTEHKLRYEDYALIPEDGLRHEVIDGVHYMNPSPIPYHQTVSRRIQYCLYAAIELEGRGVVFDAPVDVHLGEFDIIQPDLVVILEGNNIIGPIKIDGTPDMLVEILSPSTKKNDRGLKRHRYEAAGVPEYWIVDPIGRTVDQLILDQGKYSSREHGETLTLSILPDVSVNFGGVW